ncbi:MAG: FAD-dependent oxidoreductase [Eubacteriales bacterium]|nr:FAD-dependent oxidoreductase [Eubacteriales bacterium]
METKNYPVYCKTDIVVCGGGTAGAFAAISAAEQGKKVLLIEQFGSIGGSATNALVLPIMSTHIEGNPQCSYISKKVRNRIFSYGGSDESGRWFDPIILKIVLEELCLEAGVKLLYHTFISEVIREGSKMKGVLISNKAGLQIVEGNIFIDCTGDGDVSVLAGAGYTKGNPDTGKNQPISLRYIVSGIDKAALGEFFKSEIKRTGINIAINPDPANIYAAVTATGEWTLADLFKKAIANGDLAEEDRYYFQAFSIVGREDALAFNNPEFFDCVDGTDPEHLTKTQIEGRQRIFKQLKFFKKYMKGFEKAYISEIAPMVGIRESRNIEAEYILSANDIISRRKFDDAICQSNYPVDIHGKSLDFTNYSKPVDDGKPYYEIPYRSLVVRGIDNLLVAGRCLGAEFLAQSSLRVQHSVRASGEAAGIAAAYSLEKGIPPRSVDGKDVRMEMQKLGASFAE